MKLRHVFLFQTIVSTINGGLNILAPKFNMSMYGLDSLSPREVMMVQLWGAALLSYAVVAWYARNAEDSIARRSIVIGFGFTHLIGFVVSLLGTLNGTVNVMGWIAVVLYLVLAVGYGYFFFRPSS